MTGIAIGTAVLLLSRPAGDRGLVGPSCRIRSAITPIRPLRLQSVQFLGHTPVSRLVQCPLFAGPVLRRPSCRVHYLATACFFCQAPPAHQLALLIAVVAIGASLLKVHPTGTYFAWAYPFLLLGFFADSAGARESMTPTKRVATGAFLVVVSAVAVALVCVEAGLRATGFRFDTFRRCSLGIPTR